MTALRFRVFAIFIAVAFGLLALRLFYLQIVRGKEYRAASEGNRIRSIPMEAPRGIIFDRRGEPLVSNEVSFVVAVVPGEIPNPTADLSPLASVLHLDLANILPLLSSKAHDADYVKIADHLSFREFAALSEILPVPGVYVFPSPVRRVIYPLRDAHLLGYVGEVGAEELRDRASSGLAPGDIVGRDGLEKQYDAILRGKNGAEDLEVDAAGRLVKVSGETSPIRGNDVTLTLDGDVQEAAWKAVRQELLTLKSRNGIETPASVVALNPNNGEILAYVASPTFNPNWFSQGMSRAQYESLLRQGFDPLLNRPIQAAYPPGSTFKMITGTAALNEKVVTPGVNLVCPGVFSIPGMTFHCFARSGHGPIAFKEALAQSCDVYFYNVGNRLGIGRLDAYAAAFGIGALTGVDLPGESEGLLPTPDWKRKRLGEGWFPAETIGLSIGQGYLQVTPMQLAVATEMVANGGTDWRPHFLVKAEEGVSARGLPRFPEKIRTVAADPKVLALVREGMRGAVDHGTATAAKLPRVIVCGKTGTAENDPTPLNPRGRNHAWFASFAPFVNPELVVVVMMEQSGGYGGEFAAPIARKIYEAYFERKNGRHSP